MKKTIITISTLKLIFEIILFVAYVYTNNKYIGMTIVGSSIVLSIIEDIVEKIHMKDERKS